LAERPILLTVKFQLTGTGRRRVAPRAAAHPHFLDGAFRDQPISELERKQKGPLLASGPSGKMNLEKYASSPGGFKLDQNVTEVQRQIGGALGNEGGRCDPATPRHRAG
jgi:hypothetical protein